MLPLILGAVALGAIVIAKSSNSKNANNSNKGAKQTYSESLKKYGHLKSIKDYPTKIRWFEPKGDYSKRTYEKYVKGKWVKIEQIEFDYFNVSAEENINMEYVRSKKVLGGKRVWDLVKIKD
jgi:hypothetical protein